MTIESKKQPTEFVAGHHGFVPPKNKKKPSSKKKRRQQRNKQKKQFFMQNPDKANEAKENAGLVDRAIYTNAVKDPDYLYRGTRDVASAIRSDYAPKRYLGYHTAQKELYGHLFRQGLHVADEYTGRQVKFSFRPYTMNLRRMNVEHVLPQKEFDHDRHKSDLHILLPVDAEANSVRGSLPFGEVVKSDWKRGDSKRGLNVYGELVFEVPDDIKGLVARKTLYGATMANATLDPHQLDTLRLWNKVFPVTPEERELNEAIASVQGNANPYVLDPNLVDQVFGVEQLAA